MTILITFACLRLSQRYGPAVVKILKIWYYGGRLTNAWL